MSQLNRRTMLAAGSLLGAAALAGNGAPALAQGTPETPTFTPKELAFDPAGIPGLSAKLLTSHHDVNYTAAVKRLGAIKSQSAGIDKATAPGFLLNGLKREELIAWNSMVLHELYFAGFAGRTVASPELTVAIERDFGSVDKWATEFAAMGKALGGGSGWVLLQWSEHDRRLTNQWAGDHTSILVGATPLLALDMYEHAYAIDYGPKAADYVDAFMRAISWGSANQRFKRVSEFA